MRVGIFQAVRCGHHPVVRTFTLLAMTVPALAVVTLRYVALVAQLGRFASPGLLLMAALSLVSLGALVIWVTNSPASSDVL